VHITTIGLDIAKNVFQVHGIDAGSRRGLPPVAVLRVGAVAGQPERVTAFAHNALGTAMQAQPMATTGIGRRR
jgi:hypothetical protein